MSHRRITRRQTIGGLGAALAAPGVWASAPEGPHVPRRPGQAAILVDTRSGRLDVWDAAGVHATFPLSTPIAPLYTRTGLTQVVRRTVDPAWAPTPTMRRRDPGLPSFLPPGPDNPLGRHAIYLGWRYYRIHGTPADGRLGRGCINLQNAHAAAVYRIAAPGTQVLLI